MTEHEAQFYAEALRKVSPQAQVYVETFSFISGKPHFGLGVRQKNGGVIAWMYTDADVLDYLHRLHQKTQEEKGACVS